MSITKSTGYRCKCGCNLSWNEALNRLDLYLCDGCARKELHGGTIPEFYPRTNPGASPMDFLNNLIRVVIVVALWAILIAFLVGRWLS
jgi:hypothetical protein